MKLEEKVRSYFFDSTGMYASDSTIFNWLVDMRNNTVRISQEDVDYLIHTNSMLIKENEGLNDQLSDTIHQLEHIIKVKTSLDLNIQRLKLQNRNQGVVIRNQNRNSCDGCVTKINSEECYSCSRYYTDKIRYV